MSYVFRKLNDHPVICSAFCWGDWSLPGQVVSVEAKQGFKTDLKVDNQLLVPDRIKHKAIGFILNVLIFFERTAPIMEPPNKINPAKDSIFINHRTDQLVDPQKKPEYVDIAWLNRIKNGFRLMGEIFEFNPSSNSETGFRVQLDVGLVMQKYSGRACVGFLDSAKFSVFDSQ